jgi:hypothetical protein
MRGFEVWREAGDPQTCALLGLNAGGLWSMDLVWKVLS